MKFLSVIIPIYNAADYLAQCLDSLLASVGDQRPSVQLILVNDGSTDASAQICGAYARRIPEIQVFHQENGGVASARNVGLQKATGKYLAWVDPDDYVSEDWFPSIFAAAQAGEPDIIVIDTVRFDHIQTTPEIYGRSPGSLDWNVFVDDVIRDLRIRSGLPDKIMKRRLFDDLQFDTSLRILEDYAAMPQILSSGSSAYYIPKGLYYYRQHPGSLLHSSDTALAFQSVEISIARERSVAARHHQAARFAAVWQAFGFCRRHYLEPDFSAEKTQLRFCRRYVSQSLPVILGDREIPAALKVKLALLALGLYGVFVRRKHL